MKSHQPKSFFGKKHGVVLLPSGAKRSLVDHRDHFAPRHLVAGHHLLVIDDDVRFCSHLMHLSYIWSLPVTVIPPPSTPAAMAKIPGDHCDILVVSFDLPGVNGLEVAEYFNLFIRRIPTTLISGSVTFDREQGELPSYVDEFVPKSKGAVTVLRRALEAANSKYHPENYPSVLRQEANRGW